jgi:hypothetical protein
MSETLGSLCDKLTIIKLKQYHTKDPEKLGSLSEQEEQLCNEIDEFVYRASVGEIPLEKMVFSANKVFKKEGNEILQVTGKIGNIFSELAKVNCNLWHEQEKVYEFEKVPADEKDVVVKGLAILNLQRNQCINEIDKCFQRLIASKH